MKHLIFFSVIAVSCSVFGQVLPQNILAERNYQEVTQINMGEGFSLIDKFAMYPNGIDGINEHVKRTIKYPNKAKKRHLEGNVVVQYTIDTDGSVINITIENKVYSCLEKEASRVIRRMEKWEPAYQRGRPVKITYSQLFMFEL